MVALTLLASLMVGFIGAALHSRRVTESSILHAAATSMIYGLIEQMKQLEYATQLPSHATDPFAPASLSPPYIRIRLNQATVVWLRTVHTLAPNAAAAPTTTPAPAATTVSAGAIDNFIGSLPLSTVTGSLSQQINLNLWVWVDEIPQGDASEVKKVTVVYTYSYMDGSTERFVRDREVFLRTRFDQ